MITIKILGLDNLKHKKLSRNLHLALQRSGISAKVLQITDIESIINMGVEAIPALLLEQDTVLADKRVPTVEEIQEILTRYHYYSSSIDLRSAGE